METNTTEVWRVFGLTEPQILEKLEPCLQNKHKIEFELLPLGINEFEVRMHYQPKSQFAIVDELKKRVVKLLEDNIYTNSTDTLEELIVKVLAERDKKLCCVESFTGGLLTAAIVKVEGAGEVLTEGLVTYTNAAKVGRLGVDAATLERFGAVDIETVYEMAACTLMNTGVDYVMATTGNAGPTVDKKGKNSKIGKFFVAVGSADGVHVYPEYLPDHTRSEVMEYGVRCALYRLYKKLTENKIQ